MSGSYGYARNPPPPPPRETIYDLLRGIIGRVPWRDEGEQKRFTELLNHLEQVNVFGYMATKITTNMSEDET